MRADLVVAIRRLLLGVIVLGLLATAGLAYRSVRAGEGPAWLRGPAVVQLTLAGRHIGIVAGHTGNDTGTVCQDGLTEVSVNEAVAGRVVADLRRRGAQVDLLKEFDERLTDYQADAFVSIHTDSCQASFSGYKIAPAMAGSTASQRLADCLWQRYGEVTGLPSPSRYHYRRHAPISCLAQDLARLPGGHHRDWLPEHRPQDIGRQPANRGRRHRAGFHCCLAPPRQTPAPAPGQ